MPQSKREPLFNFVKELAAPAERAAEIKSNFTPRFCHSYFALYGDTLLRPDPDPYPDGYLDRLAGLGLDGVWLQAVL